MWRETMYRMNTGKKGLHEKSNGNGLMVINCETDQDLIMSSIALHHKNIQKGIWKSPDWKNIDQSDFLLAGMNHKKSIEGVSSYRGAGGDTDHFLLVGKAKLKMLFCSKQMSDRNTPLELDKLYRSEIARRYHMAARNRSETLIATEQSDEEVAVDVM
ncbi:uncharacterized protein LOC126470947 [Schistocerca serialis cubense]|uniref:uncharacterized protein LOC126470947 n=1 Tax=Schistocerca serialis cubense TaxID=2023355 RepID=UPI00214E5B24|nr:uncharacterized protein LOC126470947 [Schistocerca serialis cubense]